MVHKEFLKLVLIFNFMFYEKSCFIFNIVLVFRSRSTVFLSSIICFLIKINTKPPAAARTFLTEGNPFAWW